MNAYRWAWRASWLMIGLVPVGLGLLEASPVALFCLGSLVAVAVAATGQPAATWFVSGLLGAAAVAALWSTGEAGFVLLMLAFATAPPVVARVGASFRRRRRRRRRRRPSARPGAEAGEVVVVPVLSADLWAGPVHALDDQQLCLSWSESFVALKLARTRDERLELVNLRQAYLDELESRNPAGFESWLRSRAMPIGNPHSFLEAREYDQAGNLADPPSDPVDRKTEER